MSISEIKKTAKSKMEGHYGEAIKLLVLIIIGEAIFSIIDGYIGVSIGFVNSDGRSAFNLLSTLFSVIMSIGSTSFFLKIARGQEATYKELIQHKELIIPYFIITILTGIFVVLWSLLLIIPGIIAAFSYSLVLYILLDEPNLDAMDVIKKSKELMKGNKWKLFCLEISFIGWTILGIFTLGILYLWLAPYMSTSLAVFYDDIKQRADVNQQVQA